VHLAFTLGDGKFARKDIGAPAGRDHGAARPI